MRAELGTVTGRYETRGVHEHLFFGQGEMNIRAILAALHEINFQNRVRRTSRAIRTAQIVPAAIEYLRQTEKSSSTLSSGKHDTFVGE